MVRFGKLARLDEAAGAESKRGGILLEEYEIGSDLEDGARPEKCAVRGHGRIGGLVLSPGGIFAVPVESSDHGPRAYGRLQ